MEVLGYEQVVHQILDLKPERRTDLSAIKILLDAYGNPQQSYPTIHIAGTNGKGQVAVKIARALQEEGHRVGLFISPHIFDYAERITINGKKIPRQTVVDYANELEEIYNRLGIKPNFFECTTVMGFRYFAEKNVDIAIIETGLGGKFDSTNVIEPLVSIITSVGFDHTCYLGSTIEEISEQKAGIIKKNVPVIVGPRAKFGPIFEKAGQMDAKVLIVEKQSCNYDTENQAIAKEALTTLKAPFSVSQSSMLVGLRASLPCRLQKRGRVIYDVAHNPDGFARLIDALSHLYPYRKFRFVIGMGMKKDWESCLKHIGPVSNHVYFVKAQREDSASPEDLAYVFELISSSPCSTEESVSAGMRRAKQELQKDEILVVCGSFYIMHEAYE